MIEISITVFFATRDLRPAGTESVPPQNNQSKSPGRPSGQKWWWYDDNDDDDDGLLLTLYIIEVFNLLLKKKSSVCNILENRIQGFFQRYFQKNCIYIFSFLFWRSLGGLHFKLSKNEVNIKKQVINNGKFMLRIFFLLKKKQFKIINLNCQMG